MKDIIQIEFKRLIGKKYYYIILIVFIYCVILNISLLDKYNIYDNTGNIVISYKDNLKISKNKPNVTLDQTTIDNIINTSQNNNYLYTSNLTLLVAGNYNKNINLLTLNDINNFYNQRINNIAINMGGSIYSDTAYTIANKSNFSMDTPIQYGYAEGWKIVNNTLTDFVTIIILIIPYLLTPLFTYTENSTMKSLIFSCKYGKKDLVLARFLSAYLIESIIYTTCIIIFTFIPLIIFGKQGTLLPIQSSIKFLFSPYDLTYLSQYFINISIGLIALFILVSLNLLISIINEKIISTSIIYTFYIIISIMLRKTSLFISHYFLNFIPYHMVDFNSYYIHPDIYIINNLIIPAHWWVMIIGIVQILIYIYLCYKLAIQFTLKNKSDSPFLLFTIQQNLL